MTTTVQELIKNLKHHTDNTVVIIKDVDDQEFAIVDFVFADGGLTILIGETGDEQGEEENVGGDSEDE